MFYSQIGTLNNTQDVDMLRQWILQEYKTDIQERPSLHVYTTKLPTEIQKLIDNLRYAPEITDAICSKFEQCDMNRIKALSSSDELYISHYNKDNGGDQGLFDKHYDGSLRIMKHSTVVRALIYINADDSYVVKFLDSGIEHNFKTYEFGLLDFHNELHEVHGEYNRKDTPRILLKCQYLICPNCTPWYEKLTILLNLYIFYVVKHCMEYSKSPKTSFQRFVGWICNVMRILNMLHPLLPLLFLTSAVVIVVLIPYIMWDLISLYNNKVPHATISKKTVGFSKNNKSYSIQ